MKHRANFLLLIAILFLGFNLMFQACQKENFFAPDTPSESAPGFAQERDLTTMATYKTVVAKCVAKGLSDPAFQAFFRAAAASGEGNQDGFSLWRYRDELVAPNMTLARFLAVQAGQLGYMTTTYNTEFFRGELVRYAPNLSIGISIWGNAAISNYVFSAGLKTAVIPTNYYTDSETAGNCTLYSQTMISSVADVDNANYDFVYVEENPYYELFKTSNNKSLASDKTVIQMHALPENPELDAEFVADATGSTYKFRLPGVENIRGVNCYLVDKNRVMAFYTGGPGGSEGPGGPGGGDPPGGDPPAGGPCDGDCERDDLEGYERVRFVYMVNGSDLRKKFGCKRIHKNCTFAITQYRFVPDENNSAAVASQTTKVVSLWEKGLRNGEWVWWNDEDNKYVRWTYCDGDYGNQMLYGVVGKNPEAGNETTNEFSAGYGGVKFKLFGAEVSLPLSLGFKFTKKKTNKDFDFGETENVYYCDPCSANSWQGQTYSTGSVRLRVREM